MGAACSSNKSIGNAVIKLTPTDNLKVGSYQFIQTLEFTDKMFKKRRGTSNKATSVSDQTVAQAPTLVLSLSQLYEAICQLSIAFSFTTSVDTDSGRIEFALTRDNEVIHKIELLDVKPNEEYSVTFGYKIANPLVNLSQAGDFYQIHIYLD